jgi:hypothetical protein
MVWSLSRPYLRLLPDSIGICPEGTLSQPELYSVGHLITPSTKITTNIRANGVNVISQAEWNCALMPVVIAGSKHHC